MAARDAKDTSDRCPVEPGDDVDERYVAIEAGANDDEIVVYDQDNSTAWIQSDTFAWREDVE